MVSLLIRLVNRLRIVDFMSLFFGKKNLHIGLANISHQSVRGKCLFFVTKSVMKCQTSAAFGIDTTSGYSLVKRRGVAFFGEWIPGWSAQAFMTSYLTGHPFLKKTVVTMKEAVRKQAYLN
jgi:hypothetical protein